MSKPPEYLKAWIFLLEKANFADNHNLKRGQGFTSISELMDVLSYRVGYRKVIPSKKKVWGIIEWLRGSCEGNYEGNHEGTMKVTTNVPMIETTKVTHGFVYNICKYDIYQNPNNYEGNRKIQDEGNNEGSAKELRREPEGNNKYKNGNKDKKRTNTIKANSETISTVICSYTDDIGLQEALFGWNEMRNLKKKPLTVRALRTALEKLDKLEGDKVYNVDYATMKCWEGFYQPQEYNKTQALTKHKPEQSKYQTVNYESRSD